MRSFVVSAVALAGITAGYVFSANTPPIGVAVTVGNFLLNDAQTSGNATIFDGATVQAGANTAQVKLNGGAQVSLLQESKGRVFADHLDLKKGSARVAGYSLTADGLKVEAQGASAASVTMHGKTLEVASLYGNVKVFNANGMTVANLLPGRALNLTPQDAGAAAPSQLVGCVAKKGNDYFLQDETSNVTVQLKGGTVKENRRFQVNGTMVPNGGPVAPATQVINVASQKDLNKGCRGAAVLAGGAAGAAGAGAAAGGAGAAGAGAGAAAAGAAGAGVAASTAVVAGVAAAAAGVGGAAAAGSFNCTPVSPSTTC